MEALKKLLETEKEIIDSYFFLTDYTTLKTQADKT
jgi:hypothetical protein